jgi:hypothetical protein
LIQILSINPKPAAEPVIAHVRRPCVNCRAFAAGREKGGIRLAKAAFKPGNVEVFASSRFTAR